MKKILFTICCGLIALTSKAQLTSVDFSASNSTGQVFYYHITDAVNRYVEITHPDISSSLYQFAGQEVKLPSTVLNSNNNQYYTVTGIGYDAFKEAKASTLVLSESIKNIGAYSFQRSKLDSIYFPDGLEKIDEGAFQFSSGLKYLKLPSTINYLGTGCFMSMSDLTQIYGLTELNLSNKSIPAFFLRTNTKLKIPHLVLQNITFVGRFAFESCTINSITLPETIEEIEDCAFYCNDLNEVTIKAATPPTISDKYIFGTSATKNFYIPADATAAYMNATHWKDVFGTFYEQLTIGATGYTTYYLENENFRVPTGCTAYIITDIQPGATAAAPYKAMTQSIAAGSIIPKQTGFILQGTAGSTVEYEANVTGTEVSVSNNLLVGTATEAKVGNDGTNKYYLFGHKGTNQGFYWQTGTGGEYVNLKAHKAALKVAKSQVGYAKSFVIDFEDTTTGIRNIDDTTPQKNDIIYDLQGRRVINPTHGIYIVNGKKQVFN